MTFSAYVQSGSYELINTTRENSTKGGVAIAQKLAPAWVEIVKDEIGVSLFRYCSEGSYIADSWHETVEDAKRQAEKEFGISEENWFED